MHDQPDGSSKRIFLEASFTEEVASEAWNNIDSTSSAEQGVVGERSGSE